jgi:hypothetical protein
VFEVMVLKDKYMVKFTVLTQKGANGIKVRKG